MCPWTPSCGNGHAFKGYEIQEKPPGVLHKVQPRIKVWKLKKQEIRKAYLEKFQERNIDIEENSVRAEEQWDKVEKAMTEVAATVCGVTKRQM